MFWKSYALTRVHPFERHNRGSVNGRPLMANTVYKTMHLALEHHSGKNLIGQQLWTSTDTHTCIYLTLTNTLQPFSIYLVFVLFNHCSTKWL